MQNMKQEKHKTAFVIFLIICWLTSCSFKSIDAEDTTPISPDLPTDDAVAEYLDDLIDTGIINKEMYISQAYLTIDSRTDSYCQFWYFFFDEHELQAMLNLSIHPNAEGHHANSAHRVSNNDTIKACFKNILDENLAFALVITGSEDYPLIVLCAEDGSETILRPEGESDAGIELDETDEIFSLHCFERNALELQRVSDIIGDRE